METHGRDEATDRVLMSKQAVPFKESPIESDPRILSPSNLFDLLPLASLGHINLDGSKFKASSSKLT